MLHQTLNVNELSSSFAIVNEWQLLITFGDNEQTMITANTVKTGTEKCSNAKNLLEYELPCNLQWNKIQRLSNAILFNSISAQSELKVKRHTLGNVL